MRLKYEPFLEPPHNSEKKLFVNRELYQTGKSLMVVVGGAAEAMHAFPQENNLQDV